MNGKAFDKANYRVYRSVAVFTDEKNHMRRLALYTLAMSVYLAEQKAIVEAPDAYTVVRTESLGSFRSWKALTGREVRNPEDEPVVVATLE